MSLDFLNKKNWTCASLNSIRKIWENEQKEKLKIQTNDENKKKLQEENHAQELKKAKIEAELIPKCSFDKMQVCFIQASEQHQQNTEQYLIGKLEDKNNLLVRDGLQDPKVKRNNCQSNISEDVTNNTFENFNLNDDPLIKIYLEEKQVKSRSRSRSKHKHKKDKESKMKQNKTKKEIYSGEKDVKPLTYQSGKNKTRQVRNLKDKDAFKN